MFVCVSAGVHVCVCACVCVCQALLRDKPRKKRPETIYTDHFLCRDEPSLLNLPEDSTLCYRFNLHTAHLFHLRSSKAAIYLHHLDFLKSAMTIGRDVQSPVACPFFCFVISNFKAQNLNIWGSSRQTLRHVIITKVGGRQHNSLLFSYFCTVGGSHLPLFCSFKVFYLGMLFCLWSKQWQP